MSSRIIIGLVVLAIMGCIQSDPIHIPSPERTTVEISTQKLTPEARKDKILGAIVGSAIGDAMGASTEMWHRRQIQREYGYINGLTPAIRAQSPEGTWEHNLIAGATTDDTRWKYFITQYFLSNKGSISTDRFAAFINSYYETEVKKLSDYGPQNSTDALDAQVEKVDWIKEWARVSKAYIAGEDEYHRAQSRFYGGEMSCAGLLYSPMFGLIAEHPVSAYLMAYQHTIFDLGYAKDISAMSSVMTHLALKGKDFSAVVDSSLLADPVGYKDSRLVGRILLSSADEIANIIKAANELDTHDTTLINIPRGYPGSSVDWIKQDFIYQELEKRQKAIAFHAGEIWDITYASLLFGEGDFRKTMAFIVNYGRDNDTVAAIVGTILGAYNGYDALPDDLKLETVRVNKEVIGIDLLELANDLTESFAVTSK